MQEYWRSDANNQSRMRSQTFEKTLVEFGKIQKWLINDKHVSEEYQN